MGDVGKKKNKRHDSAGSGTAWAAAEDPLARRFRLHRADEMAAAREQLTSANSYDDAVLDVVVDRLLEEFAAMDGASRPRLSQSGAGHTEADATVLRDDAPVVVTMRTSRRDGAVVARIGQPAR
ncbi:MAG: hypothetical protein AAF235_07355 [Planctomycetota bacterium]